MAQKEKMVPEAPTTAPAPEAELPEAPTTVASDQEEKVVLGVVAEHRPVEREARVETVRTVGGAELTVTTY